MHLAHLEEGDTGNDKDPESDDPSGIEGVTEEFMVHLARTVKDPQADEKCCYHCSCPEHFIHNSLFVKTSRDKKQLNGKEGMASMTGNLDCSNNDKCSQRAPRQRLPRHKDHSTDSLLQSRPLSVMIWDRKCS